MNRYSRINSCVVHTVNKENLTSQNKIQIECLFTKISKNRKSPFYTGVDLWNSLKVVHHQAENTKRFKK